VFKSQFGMWGGFLVRAICLVKCLHSAFLNHIKLFQDPVEDHVVFNMWFGSRVIMFCLVKCLYSALLKSYYPFPGLCCVQVTVCSVLQTHGYDGPPRQVAPFCLLKSYYPSSGPLCLSLSLAMWSGSLVMTICLVRCLHSAF
jgi:hypothetical protein